jgi:hypothetical protein
MMASPSDKVKFLLRVEGDILSTLRELAKSKEISLSQLLRDILRGYVNNLTIPIPNEAQERNRLRRVKKQWWH